MPTKLPTPIPDNYDTLQLKADFFKNVIDLGNGTFRFVAKMHDRFDQNYNPNNTGRLFVPASPNDDFDLVLSLATDGAHYLTVDWDRSMPPAGAFDPGPWTAFQHNGTNVIFTPSTMNTHMWGRNTLSWQNMLGILKADIVDNPKYAQACETKGYAALRPPWHHKSEVIPDDTIWTSHDWSERFRNFQYGTGTPPPKGEGWDDLWDDDET